MGEFCISAENIAFKVSALHGQITEVMMSHTEQAPANDGKPNNVLPKGTLNKSTRVRLEDDKIEPLAIIGFFARLPQDGDSVEGFWRLLCDGLSAAREIPKERSDLDAFYRPDVDMIDTVCS